MYLLRIRFFEGIRELIWKIMEGNKVFSSLIEFICPFIGTHI